MRNMTKATRRGLIVANDAAHVVISVHVHKAYLVRSWRNGVSPKTQDAFYAVMQAAGLRAESVFDAAHGFRYMIFVYSTPEERKACWDCVTGNKAEDN